MLLQQQWQQVVVLLFSYPMTPTHVPANMRRIAAAINPMHGTYQQSDGSHGQCNATDEGTLIGQHSHLHWHSICNNCIAPSRNLRCSPASKTRQVGLTIATARFLN